MQKELKFVLSDSVYKRIETAVINNYMPADGQPIEDPELFINDLIKKFLTDQVLRYESRRDQKKAAETAESNVIKDIKFS